MASDEEQLQAYVVEYLHKRRRLLTQNSSSLEEQSRFHSVLDELLEEILFRLPCSKVAVLCKLVCKHWSALISDPNFIRQFVVFKARNKWLKIGVSGCADMNVLERRERTFAIVVRRVSKTGEGWILQLKDPLSNLLDFSVSPLTIPCLVDEIRAPVMIAGACNDLLLCLRDTPNRNDYFIYNVQTKQSLLLPSTPFYYNLQTQCAVHGFICDPFYTCEGKISNCSVTLNDVFRYFAIVVHCTNRPASMYNAHLISSSSSNQWTLVKMSLPRRCRLVGMCHSFVFARRLFIRCDDGVICFNPYRGGKNAGRVIKCHYIGRPIGSRANFCTEMRQGQLQISNMDNYRVFTSWVLKDYKKGEWSLLHRIEHHEWIPRDRFVAKGRKKDILWPGILLSVHPFNPDIIYLLSPLRIVLGNASNRTLEAASRFSTTKFNRLYQLVFKFPMLLPTWPTPLPTLGENKC